MDITGTITFQLDNITKRIKQLQVHLQKSRKDFNSKQVLYELVAKRKIFLRYLERKNPVLFEQYIKESKLRIKNKS